MKTILILGLIGVTATISQARVGDTKEQWAGRLEYRNQVSDNMTVRRDNLSVSATFTNGVCVREVYCRLTGEFEAREISDLTSRQPTGTVRGLGGIDYQDADSFTTRKTRAAICIIEFASPEYVRQRKAERQAKRNPLGRL